MQKNKMVFQAAKCLSEEEIQLYLNGSLDESSRYRVENHLLDCPLCAEAVEGFADDYKFGKDEQLEELREALKEKIRIVPETREIRFWTLNRIAAAILLIIIPSAAWFYWNAQITEKGYLAELQSSKDLIDNVRGGEAFPAGIQYSEGLEFYRNEGYRESLFFFNNLLESEPENSIAHYFAGLSALNLGELEQAIENLNYARFNDEKYYEDATWNLVLANYGLGKKEEAKALIADLLKIEGGFYSDKAERLLREIEEK